MPSRCTARSSSIERRRALGTPYSPAWFSSVSKGVKKGSNTISCGTMPIEPLALRGFRSISKPQMVTEPEVFVTIPDRMLMSVDLPAPFGPSSPNMVPRGTSKVTSSSARFPPA